MRLTLPTASVRPRSRRSAPAGRSCARGRGFTLIELVIAIAVAAALFGAVAMGVESVTGARAREAAGELSAGIRMMYDEAALSGRTCRIVFTLPDSKDDEEAHVAWRAECAERGITAFKDRDEELEAANEAERDRGTGSDKAAKAIAMREQRNFQLTDAPSLEELLGDTKAQVSQAMSFSEFTSPLLESLELPSSVRIGVWTRHQKEAVDEGVAYLYFYPQGYTERAMVYVSQGENVWTIKVSPLTGKTEIIPEREEVPR